MYTISDKFRAALVKSHTVIQRCDVLSPTGTLLRTLNITDGQVTVDDVEQRRRCELAAIEDPDTLVPAVATDLLSPQSGNELRLYRGIRFSDGTEEYIPLGVFSVADIQFDESGQGLHIRIEGWDRSRRLSDAKMAAAYTVPDGRNAKTAIQDLATFRYPTISFSATWTAFSTSSTLPQQTLVTGDNPWNKITKWGLEALGSDVYFDVNGQLTIVPVPNTDAQPPTWTYQEGAEATFLYINKRLTSDESPNHIIVFGEHPDNTDPIKGQAFDSNPSSPTYYLGTYGDRVKTFEGQAVKTVAQANQWAEALLRKNLGISELVRFNGIVNPAHEVGDVIGIFHDRTRINAMYVIDKLTIPLLPERVMEVSTRRRKV